MVYRIKTVDAHVAGEPLRTIIAGFPLPPAATMAHQRQWVRQHCDHLRQALMLEPRGHHDMFGALITTPGEPRCDVGVLFMDGQGLGSMCGHGIIGVVTIGFEYGLFRSNVECVTVDTPAGTILARACFESVAEGHRQRRRTAKSVTFQNVPSFVCRESIIVDIDTMRVPVAVSFGGAFYAVVDIGALGFPLTCLNIDRIRAVGLEIRKRVEAAYEPIHPVDSAVRGLYGTILIDLAQIRSGLLRTATVFAEGQVDRSPCGTGTSAVLAYLTNKEWITPGEEVISESIIGTQFRGRVVSRCVVGRCAAVVPEIEGSAWLTGEHTFVIDPDDPLACGFRLEPARDFDGVASLRPRDIVSN